MEPNNLIYGQIDSTFVTHQRSMFTSGLVAEIGTNAFTVWSAIKYHADFQTGEAHPGLRGLGLMLGLSKDTVGRAVSVLQCAHLLRIVKPSQFKRKGQTYVARERIEVKVAQQTICIVAIDYVPATLRTRISRLNKFLDSGQNDPSLWSQIEIIPGAGFSWDKDSKTLKTYELINPHDSKEFESDDANKNQIAKVELSKIMAMVAKKVLHTNSASSQTRAFGTSYPQDKNPEQ